ncbi:MAG TPA: adenylate/guanylate cyclase domain-containing protein [Acidimicrobiales bacterium]
MSEHDPTDGGEGASTSSEVDVEAIARVLEPFIGEIEARFTLDEVAERYDLDGDTLRRQWRALGFPDPRPGEKVVSEWEAEVLGRVVEAFFVEARDEAISTHVSRVMASALDRVASAQIDALVRRAPVVKDDPSARVRVARSSALTPRMLELVWRRRLAVEAQRRLLRTSASTGVPVCVGFADMVGFTVQTERLDVEALANVVERFEAIAYGVVHSHGGRVVKTIGDEVMFVNDDVVECCRTALELARRYRDDDALSDVRVGLANGLVLERDGDVFGHPVNLASRIVSSTFPGLVVVSADVHDAVQDVEEFAFAALRSQFLKDIGQVPLWRMYSADDPVEDLVRNARRDLTSRHRERDNRWEHQRREALERTEAMVAGLGIDLTSLPERLGDVVRDTSPEAVARVLADPTSQELESIAVSVLRSDLDPEVREDLIAELATARALREVQLDVEYKAVEADSVAESELRRIEREMAAALKALDKDRRERLAEILDRAAAAAAEVDEQAARRLQEVTDEAGHRAEEASRIAREKARDARERFER